MREHRYHHGHPGSSWKRHSPGAWSFGPPPWAGRRRRGDVRAAILAVLAEEPKHGYDLMRDLEERSGGTWRPSPGSIYPTLQLLEDEGLVTADAREGKRVYSLTDDGRAEVEERKARAGAAPWELNGGSEALTTLREEGFQLAAATMQVARAGVETQIERAAAVLARARKELYSLLAED